MIYYILNVNELAIKIGYTDNLAKRLSQLQTANSTTLQILLVTYGNKEVENNLHKKFQHLHIRGE